MLVANLVALEASLGVANKALMVSLKAKLRAWVRKKSIETERIKNLLSQLAKIDIA